MRLGSPERVIRRWETGGRIPICRKTVRILNALARDVGLPPLSQNAAD